MAMWCDDWRAGEVKGSLTDERTEAYRIQQDCVMDSSGSEALSVSYCSVPGLGWAGGKYGIIRLKLGCVFGDSSTG